MKRYLAVTLLSCAAASLALAVCPLSSPSNADATNSPEKPQKCYLVSHNKNKDVCVPANEAAAHKSYGDPVGKQCTCPTH